MYVPVLLSAAIVEELELIWVCCRWHVDLFCFHVVADVSNVLCTVVSWGVTVFLSLMIWVETERVFSFNLSMTPAGRNLDEYYKNLLIQSSAPDDGQKHHPEHVEPTRNSKLTFIVASYHVGYFHNCTFHICGNTKASQMWKVTHLKIQHFLLVFRLYKK
jgi:hypothetical protein